MYNNTGENNPLPPSSGGHHGGGDDVNRRRSIGGDSTGTRSTACFSEADQSVRRKRIQEIMKDPSMSQLEKSKTIQGLMDGRRCNSSRRSSIDSNLSRSVQSTASASSSCQQQQQNPLRPHSDEEGDAVMMEANNPHHRLGASYASAASSNGGHGGMFHPGNFAPAHIYDYNGHDNRSVASSISNASGHGEEEEEAGGEKVPKGSYRQIHGRSFSLQDWNDESRIAAAGHIPSLFNDVPNANPQQVNRLMESSRPKCSHYERNCTIIAACCGLAFGCRICHDDCPVLPPPIRVRMRRQEQNYASPLVADEVCKQASSHHHTAFERRRSMPLENEPYYDPDEEENHHLIDRFAIREVICRKCFTRQSSKTNNCRSCGVQFGAYHCNICNLWMPDSESPYHCTDCGFCRVGGRENFRHCRDCGMCIDTLLFDNHNCKAGKYNSNCPVCQEDLFSSRSASHEMPCGHAIHWHCFKELTTFDTRCPVCKKTAETPEQMASTWSALAMGIALQPVPSELARVVNILCNDCEERDYERRWHFLGVRCMHCLSFNTNVEQIILQGIEAAQYLDAQEAARGEETGGVPPTISALALRSNNAFGDDLNNSGFLDEDMDEDYEDGAS